MRSIYFALLYIFFTSALSYTYLFQLHQQHNKYDQKQCNIFIGKFIEGYSESEKSAKNHVFFLYVV